ncbi:ribosome biogenesis GTP-binding protein YsxC [Candidatus Gottesmanbacteria bacterium RIFCSPHIGHO2_02_FULL_40_24]|nr:MAG: ribosome biogenesis GTP-binding protein YsxC [Candidatus Gottesmanbacteria bacterium RIFCSPHIGHO2_02_FULL_40_24]OGG22466.1 MAG: ribosome biogenesis GTP-binding protein YsxC [Candidatus Gottesmanbacteria bacterium RIFCSPLOWO2_01_FULL_40_10]OGG24848.1 MAG: ribosome biogenesis GTP-binding protein YsxC [Candidatus Gottesmanbacteria bacterium RIFCSPHIGHO2_12_FULL_40_13]OGG32169.1 MAG: ribosome biogenesis GTP-binding protein YsxC [Candidatus Gottesmanbacteria bacterium RIFCSPLOWO2_02_FULL_40_1
MKIISAKFVKGITGTADILYDGKFQVAFIGRSNVGKSTLINSLVNKKHLARTSSHPGQTIRMDFFLINDKFYFVDFPGYGYAKLSGDKREKLRKMILWYLLYSEVKNRLVILILDAKVGITDFDRNTLDTFAEHKINHLIIANKIDNLKINIREKQFDTIKSQCPASALIAYSSKLRTGRPELLESLNRYIS